MHEIICLSPIRTDQRSVADPWRYLEEQGLIRMKYCEFRLIAQLQWILRGKERSPIWRVARNVWWLAVLLFSRNRIIMVGTESYRWTTLTVNWLKARHRCLWAGSWPWHTEDFKRGLLPSVQRKRCIRFFQGMICATPSQPARSTLETFGADAYYIPWSVDTEVFVPGTSRDPASPAVVLFVGELWELKGIPLILNIIRNHPWKGVKFVFVGKGKYGRAIMKMQEQGYPVEYLGLINDRQELAHIMRASDMLILPSIRISGMEEKFGMVLIEAGACGLPVIGSDCEGPRLIIQHEKTGLLISQNSETALREAILRLVHDPALRRIMGENGRQQAVQEFDVKVVAWRWWEVFQKTANQKSPIRKH